MLQLQTCCCVVVVNVSDKSSDKSFFSLHLPLIHDVAKNSLIDISTLMSESSLAFSQEIKGVNGVKLFNLFDLQRQLQYRVPKRKIIPIELEHRFQR